MQQAFRMEEFQKICDRFGVAPRIRDVELCFDTPKFVLRMRDYMSCDRRGEVVFAVIRPNGCIVTITCREYPTGVYRVPTGGINLTEDILEAVTRETTEELGLETEISHFGGVVRIHFISGEEKVTFYSYLFILKELRGSILEDATEDEVSAVREETLDDLFETSRRLGQIEGFWRDWGRFREVSTAAIWDYLNELVHEGDQILRDRT